MKISKDCMVAVIQTLINEISLSNETIDENKCIPISISDSHFVPLKSIFDNMPNFNEDEIKSALYVLYKDRIITLEGDKNGMYKKVEFTEKGYDMILNNFI